MPRKPEIGNVQLYPNRPLHEGDKNGYVLKFYCPLHQKRIRKSCGTRDRREARKILRECRERLLNGKYIKTEGIITEELDIQTRIPVSSASREDVEYPSDMRWQDCFEQYYEHQKQRVREKSLEDSASRIRIAERILETSRNKSSLPENGNIQEYITLSKLEYLQDRLLAGEESRFKSRSLTTVNTTMGAIMAFIRYCHRHGWIKNVPPITKLSVDEVMKGRPVLVEEYEEMKNVVAGVVGERSSDSWKYVIRIIWESAFRISEVMNFSWDDDRKIHPVWPKRKGVHPTIIVPSTQKNGKIQEIPMLPGLERILEEVPKQNRSGWVVNPLPMDYEIKTDTEWLKPTKADLVKLAKLYNNSAIARACSVSETTVRKWLVKSQIERQTEFNCHQGEIDSAAITILRKRAEKQSTREAQRPNQRLSTERVSRIIAMIGKQANIIVQQPDKETGRRLKYASAHDLRRGCVHRLINAGVSAETLKVILRHKDFATTEKFYGATKSAQAAATEIHDKLDDKITTIKSGSQLSDEEIQRLKCILKLLRVWSPYSSFNRLVRYFQTTASEVEMLLSAPAHNRHVRVQAILHETPLLISLDQSGMKQNPQMVGNIYDFFAEAVCDFADSSFSITKKIDDADTNGFPQRLEFSSTQLGLKPVFSHKCHHEKSFHLSHQPNRLDDIRRMSVVQYGNILNRGGTTERCV